MLKKKIFATVACLSIFANTLLPVSCNAETADSIPDTKPSVVQSDQTRIQTLEKRIEILESSLARVKDLEQKNISSKKDSTWDLNFGGRVFNDWVYPEENNILKGKIGPVKNGTEFRKARLVMEGKAPAKMEFKFEINFTDGDADLTDALVTMPGFKKTRVSIGQHKEAFSMDNVGSSNHTLFMERAPVSETLSPKRNNGITVFAEKQAPHPGFWLGYFHNANGAGLSNDGGGQTITARYTVQPVFSDDGKRLLHLGASYNHRTYGSSQPDFKLRTGSHFMPAMASTGKLAARSADLYGGQFMHVSGSFGASGELNHTRIRLDNGRQADLDGGYASLFWYLTGEHQAFDKKRRAPAQVKPFRNFEDWRGGAWMLACRYDYLDLVDKNEGINGGKLKEWTVGLNWLLNQNQKIMFNYIKAKNTIDSGTANIFQTRFQVNF